VSSDGNASPQLGHATVAAEVAPLATASGWREAGEEMRGVKGVNSAGADWRVGSGDCLGTGLGLELGFPGWEEGEGPEPRTGEVPLKVEGEEEVTFFMNFFILPFIMTAGDGETAAATAERALVERGFGRVDAVTRSGLLGGRDGRGRCRGRGEANKWGSWRCPFCEGPIAAGRPNGSPRVPLLRIGYLQLRRQLEKGPYTK
jgi:hypothetical protein